MQITLAFLGASGTVTGSKYLLTVNGRRILVDAGMYQGERVWTEKNYDALPIDVSTCTDVLLTHAHADHSTYLPKLVKDGFHGHIWATAPSIKLTEIVLRDAGKLQEMAAEEANEAGLGGIEPIVPIYTVADVEKTLPLMRSVAWDTQIDLGEGITAQWVRSGHILGSASITVFFEGTPVVVFSGDLGRHDHPILKGRQNPVSAPYVVMESTYGDREHPEPEIPHEGFAEAIRTTVKRGGKIIVPAFAIDRIETVLQALVAMWHEKRIPRVPVYVDGPMALAALDIYEAEADELKAGVSVKNFTGLPILKEARTGEQSKEINQVKEPAIIIASSGMAEGGRVVHHLQRYLSDPRTTVVLTGYQAEGTRGRELEEGARSVKINGHYVQVKATIVRDHEFSVHGDASDLLDWVKELGHPECIFVTHGDPAVAGTFAARITDELGIQAVVPKFGEVVSLVPNTPDPEDFDLETPVVETSPGPDGE